MLMTLSIQIADMPPGVRVPFPALILACSYAEPRNASI